MVRAKAILHSSIEHKCQMTRKGGYQGFLILHCYHLWEKTEHKMWSCMGNVSDLWEMCKENFPGCLYNKFIGFKR